MADINPTVSANFSLAKVIAIFTVVAGHWFTGTILWIPVTFGLFVFAFSSAYFTTLIYGDQVDTRKFWRKKLERLGLRYWFILLFLSVVIVLQGKQLLHWHTLVHFAGLSGVLNWFAIQNRSGLGAGLWFFTLLLIFYLAYPALAKLSRFKIAAAVLTLLAGLAAVYLEEKVKVGHELWLTSFGFILGVTYGLQEPKLNAWVAFVTAIAACICLLGLNLFSGQKQFNTILIAVASIAIAIWLTKASLPQWRVCKLIAKMDKYLLEIFLIHGYLFIHPTGKNSVDFVISLVLVVLASMLIHRSLGWISSHVAEHGLRT